MSDKHAAAFDAAVTADNKAFSAISQAWSACDSGAQANSQVSDMTNPKAASALVKSAFDGNNPFELTGSK